MAYNDRLAILRGMKAAEKLHRDLGSRKVMGPSVRVDVFSAIARTGAILMFKPLDPLLGAFMREGDLMGVMLTVRRPIGQQRFTAAHELGHLIMGHEPHADDENILRRAPMEGSYAQVPVQEREADAFASNFLLPKFLLAKLHNQQEWERRDYENPHTLYQASLRLGASYSATIQAFERDRVLTAEQRRALVKVRPRDLKADLVNGHNVQNWQDRDVWRLTEHDEGNVIEANRNDLFVLKLKEHGGSGYLWAYHELEKAGFVVLKDETEAMYPDRIGGPRRRYILGEAPDLQDGSYTLREVRPWRGDEGVNQVTVHYRRAHGREDGQYIPQIERLAAAG